MADVPKIMARIFFIMMVYLRFLTLAVSNSFQRRHKANPIDAVIQRNCTFRKVT